MSSIVIAYDPRWPTQFEGERRAIEAVLGSLLVGPVEHIGSTSVPGMPAKPIIDMMAPIAALPDAGRAVEPLVGLGYAVRPHRVDALRFVKPDIDVMEAVTHHLHLTEPTSDLWRERVVFRDSLRTSATLREEYARLKSRLLEEAGGAVYSSTGKRDFVRTVLSSGGHELRDGLHADGRA